jgi:ABC-type glycerol-3-phosphate transport system substrate-binding protein
MHHGTRALLTLCLAAAFLLTACARVPTRKIQPRGVPGAAPDTADLTVRVLSPQGDSVLDALITAYYAKYPNARVNKVAMPGGSLWKRPTGCG